MEKEDKIRQRKKQKKEKIVVDIDEELLGMQQTADAFNMLNRIITKVCWELYRKKTVRKNEKAEEDKQNKENEQNKKNGQSKKSEKQEPASELMKVIAEKNIV